MDYQTLAMPDADVVFYPAFFTAAESDVLLNRLHQEIQWKQEAARIAGKSVALPRLIAWYGDPGNRYAYSGIEIDPLPWIPLLLDIKTRVEPTLGETFHFNSVLLNLYRDQHDSVGWHSDDEPELGRNPVIASVSFGAARPFQFKHKTLRDERRSIALTHGSLLLMRGPTQHFWKHQIPKSKQPLGPRINLTFRVIQTLHETTKA